GAEPAILAVMAHVAPLEREALARRLSGDTFGDDAVDVLGVDLRAPVERPRLLEVAAGAAGEVGISLVDEIARPVEPRHPHQRRGIIGDPPEPLLALAQCALGDTLLGHVLEQDNDPAHLAL